ncbi:MAG TPA: lamin tail domain-containing protein, partial [Chloroflexota bacterium]|nr:lamin tail domain-containing protein [Chloroflexota bacterium]
ARSDLLDDRVLAPDRFVGGLLIARAPRPLLNWPNSRGWGLPETGPRLSDTAPQRPPEGPAPAAAVTSPTPPTATPAALPAPPTPDPQRSTATSSPTTSQAPRPTPTGAPPASGASLVVKAIVNEGRTEHVVVANEGTAPQELTGWTLRSGTGGQQLAFPSGFILPPGATVNLHSGNGASTQNRPPTDLFATSQNVWNNQGDSALLVDPTGRVVSQLTYGG